MESQAERMEKELASLRDLFDTARLSEDASRMISISRVIIQHEKEIAKQRIIEGTFVGIDEIHASFEAVAECVSDLIRKYLPKDEFNKFTDELVSVVQDMWRKEHARSSVSTNSEVGNPSDGSSGNIGFSEPRNGSAHTNGHAN